MGTRKGGHLVGPTPKEANTAYGGYWMLWMNGIDGINEAYQTSVKGGGAFT